MRPLRQNYRAPEAERATQNRIHPDTGETYRLVSIESPDGSFVATVNDDESFRATARTRSAAEAAAAIRFVTQTGQGPGNDIVTPEERADVQEAELDIVQGRFFRVM